MRDVATFKRSTQSCVISDTLFCGLALLDVTNLDEAETSLSSGLSENVKDNSRSLPLLFLYSWFLFHIFNTIHILAS